jgi:hypothetical protein
MRGPASSIRGPKSALALRTRGGSRVPELGTLGSVRGALSNERPYRDPLHFELRFLGGNRETAGLEDEWIGRAFSPTFLIPGCQCLDLARYLCDAFDWKRGDHRSDLLL